jgi:TRAP-type C4-dicarboxylate transport system permease small subunit
VAPTSTTGAIPEEPASILGQRSGWSPGATAAAIATALVAATASWQPWHPDGLGAWLDALVNEWIIWFAVFYLGLLATVALLERLVPLYRPARPAGERTTRDTSRPDTTRSHIRGHRTT